MVSPLFFYHIFSLTANCLVFVVYGSLKILITNPRDIPNFIKELKKFKFTAMTGLNTLFNVFLNNKNFKEVSFEKVKLVLSGGMSLNESVAEKWTNVTKRPVVKAYGLTETSPGICISPVYLKKYN